MFCPGEGSCLSRVPESVRVSLSYFIVSHPETSIVRLVMSAGRIGCPSSRIPEKSAGDNRVTLKGVDSVTLIVGSGVAMDISCNDMTRSNACVDAVYPSWSDACSARDKTVSSFGVIPFAVRALELKNIQSGRGEPSDCSTS